MIQTVRKKSRQISFALTLSIALASAMPLQGISLLPKKKHIMLPAALLTIATMFVFLTREPGHYKLKFNKEEFDKAWKNKEFKKLTKQSINYLSDLLGCRGKGSSVKVVKEDKEGKKFTLDIRPGADAIGLGGKIHQYLRPAMKALGFFVALSKFQNNIGESFDAIKDFAGYDDEMSFELSE